MKNLHPEILQLCVAIYLDLQRRRLWDFDLRLRLEDQAIGIIRKFRRRKLTS